MFKTIAAVAALALGSCVADVDTSSTQAPLVPIECNEGQVLICHIPPGNPGNMHEVCVGADAVQAHLEEHDDTVPGPCAPTCAILDAPCENPGDCCAPYQCVNGLCASQT